MDDAQLGQSTFTILRHFGFRILLEDVERMDFASMVHDVVLDEGPTIDIVMHSGDTTVSRCVPVQDLWEDPEGILIAAMAIREFFLGDR